MANFSSADSALEVQFAFEHWRVLNECVRWNAWEIGQLVRASPAAKRAAKVIGMGKLSASALTASVGGGLWLARTAATYGAPPQTGQDCLQTVTMRRRMPADADT
jgi:hypothetical protein